MGDQQTTHNEKEFPPILKRWERLGLILSLILLVFLPIILTQFSWLIVFDQTSGVIGDTIGGITAPIIGVVAAWVVYRSFEAQIFANRDLRNQHIQQMNILRQEQSLNTLIHLFQAVEDDIRKIESETTQGWTNKLMQIFQDFIAKKPTLNTKRYTIIKKKDINTAIEDPLRKIDHNITNLLRVVKLIYNHATIFKKEYYVFDFTSFYVSKIDDLISEFGYNKLNSDTTISILSEGVISPSNKEHLRILQDRVVELNGRIGNYMAMTLHENKDFK